MRLLYSLALYLISPLIVIRLWYKGRRLPAYRARIKERFACFEAPDKPIDFWFHAVSLGEVNAAIPLIDAVMKAHPKACFAITTMTPTGSKRVQDYYGERVFHVYVPYDLPTTVNRFLCKTKPRCGIIMETELWPNLIYCCAKKHIPLLVVNARLSPQSYQGYCKLTWLIGPSLNQLTKVVAQSQDDGERFINLGLKRENLKIIGNIKFDIEPAKFDNSAAITMQKAWGETRPVFIVASTHHDEEAQILEHYPKLKQTTPELMLLIAPRHPERFDEVVNLCQQQGYQVARRTQSEAISEKTDILIIDCIGELMAFFSVSTMAFIGGSFAPIGGHNVLEPISVGVPTLSGRQYFNFKAIIDELVAGGGVLLVDDAKQLIEQVSSLLSDNEKLTILNNKAQTILSANRGVIAEYTQLISELTAKQ